MAARPVDDSAGAATRDKCKEEERMKTTAILTIKRGKQWQFYEKPSSFFHFWTFDDGYVENRCCFLLL